MAKPLGYSVNPNVTYALGMQFFAGGTFPATASKTTRTYAVINQALAERLWPGQDPLQRVLYLRYFWMDAKEPTDQAIVCGVVRNFQAAGPMAANNDSIYIAFGGWAPTNLFFLARGRNALPSARMLADAVHRVDPRIALYFPDSLAHQIIMSQSSVRLTARLTLVYAVAAVLLCAVGVYSLTVSQVIQRAREFGIRLALGIEPGRLWLQFTRGHLLTALAGVAIGLAVATQVARVLQSLLYGVGRNDAATFVAVAGAIIVVAALACIPSLFRLKRINPADCLRSL